MGVPILWCPRIMIQIADADVVCGYPIFTRERYVKNFVHILVDGDICVEEGAGIISRELKGAKFRPCVFETGSDKGDSAGGEQRLNWVDSQQRVVLRFELEGLKAGFWERGCDEHDEWVGGCMLLKRIS